MGPAGFEPTVKTSGKSTFLSGGGTESGTLGANDSVPADIDLRTIIDSWPFLPPSVKANIMALVRSKEQ